MKVKLFAIWRIITCGEFYLITDNGVTASYRKENYSSIIRTYIDNTKRLIKQQGKA